MIAFVLWTSEARAIEGMNPFSHDPFRILDLGYDFADGKTPEDIAAILYDRVEVFKARFMVPGMAEDSLESLRKKVEYAIKRLSDSGRRTQAIRRSKRGYYNRRPN